MKETGKCYEKNSNFVARKVADEIILVPVTNNVCDLENLYTLDEVGARIWELIDGKNSIENIKDILLKEYDAEEEVLIKDIYSFIEQLTILNGIKEVK